MTWAHTELRRKTGSRVFGVCRTERLRRGDNVSWFRLQPPGRRRDNPLRLLHRLMSKGHPMRRYGRRQHVGDRGIATSIVAARSRADGGLSGG